mmetsp:Transcript_5123/g.7841  ORF Transcript_5123/g.7841 Transcript_5123/m.7841 type:complete len:393 (+) Transcript_5123:111-1289(+)|eukprot:CAMPEP_0185027774 /NCGR_PEP_ID=MMETSP1103-20130426/12988_1 /TAXON_ID=36769 /ORGANISM="Paraphysomonas bandaiensis, Strain Caron Lab Isolate" /LENGTH=392 /DNA_ID=CAMNT_0027561893 /DNA_START=11 /DNA_END=1189 /DNA_ORIENTATION=-
MAAKAKSTVCNPVKKSSQMGQQYVVYSVQSSFDSSDCVLSPEFTVERRYNDFVVLHKELSRAFPGAIVPPLPVDQIFGRFRQDFIEARMRGLDEFVTKVHNHPELCSAKCFRVFLTAPVFDQNALDEIKDGPHEASASKSSSWPTWKYNPTLTESQSVDTSEMDCKVEEIKHYVSNIADPTECLCDLMDKLLQCERDVARSMEKCGESYSALGSIDNDACGQSISQVGNTFRSLSAYTVEDVSEKEICAKEPLNNYMNIIKAIKAAYRAQREMKSKYLCLMGDFEGKKAAYDKEPTESKLVKVDQAQADVESAKSEYEEVSQRLLENFERLKKEKMADMIRIMEAFVSLQLSYNGKLEGALSSLDGKLNSLDSRREPLIATSASTDEDMTTI